MNSKRLSPTILILFLICFSADSPAQRLPAQSKGATGSAQSKGTAAPTQPKAAAVAAGGSATPAPLPQFPQFTEEEAFLYSLAIAGTSAPDAVDRYASYFDTANY